MFKISEVISLYFSMLKFLAHTLLIPLRLSPASWTAVTLHFSPALPASTADGGKANGQNGSSTIDEADQVQPAVPTLRSVLLESCPSLGPKSHFRPTPWLASGHLQTIFSARVKTLQIDDVIYKRRVLMMADGGTLSLDISPPELADDDLEGTIPTIVCLHGLTGGSGETYVRNCFKPLTRPKSQGGQGYRGVVVNFRSCAETPVTSPQMYSASKTSDLRSALLFLTRVFPNSPLVGIGFSLGANVLAKYMGEEGDDTPLRAAMVLGTPFDCVRGGAVLEQPGINRDVYSRAMAGNLLRVFGRGLAVFSLDSRFDQYVAATLHPPSSAESWKKRKTYPNTVCYFDDNATRIFGGYMKPYGEFPFDSAIDYYTGASSIKVLHNVRRPLLCFNARDDPIVPSELTEPVLTVMGVNGPSNPKIGLKIERKGRGNPNIVMALTLQGGHLGWWENWKPTRWIRKPILEFISSVFERDEFAHLGGKPKHAWSTKDRVVQRQVELDLLPVDALQRYVDPLSKEEEKQAHRDSAAEAEHESMTAGLEQGASSHGPGNDQLAWLRTKILEEAPFVHPFDHAFYKDAEKGKKRQEASLARGKRFQASMNLDTTRPEVGYLELLPEYRVAGAGDVFVGGLDIPGGARNTSRERIQNGVIAGL